MKVKALHAVSHDGHMYQRGETLELSKETVEQLIAAGAVRDPDAPKPAPERDVESEAEQVLADANDAAAKILADAKAEAEKVKAAAQKDADKTVSDAKAEAEKVKAAAQNTSAK